MGVSTSCLDHRTSITGICLARCDEGKRALDEKLPLCVDVFDDEGCITVKPRFQQRASSAHCLQVGNSISASLLEKCEQLGILVDKDDKGVVLQIFTKPLGALFLSYFVRSLLFCLH